jgi:hypothetical protein
MGSIGDLFGGSAAGDLFGGDDDAGDAAIEASQIQADYQREALDYLKETEALPQTYREGALQALGAEYGFTTDAEGNVVPSDQSITERVKSGEVYQSLLGGQAAGEEAILRQASATGGLRSGNVQEALYDYNTQLENEAFLTAYNQQVQGLQGLAGLPSLATSIASGTSDIGTTLGQGIVAEAQAEQAASQQGVSNALSAANLALVAASTFSDRRLKTNIRFIGNRQGIPFYRWTWNARAQTMGFTGECEGVIAQEVEKIKPDAVYQLPNGYLAVDMAKIMQEVA